MKISSTGKMVFFCIALVLIRFVATEKFSFFFLIWNLFLAWSPYFFIRKYFKRDRLPEQLMLLGLTILFLPNAPYILTDLFHLSKNLVAPQWFDLILILSFSVAGLIYFIKTCELLFFILSKVIKSQLLFNMIKGLIVISNGYGIYLGRYLRFNSWDIISNPNSLAKRMFISIFDSHHYRETFAITMTFAMFLYLILELSDSLKNRMRPDELSQRP